MSKPSFVSKDMFSKNKPIYVGFSMPDSRKLLMHEFQYKYIKSKFDANLLFTETYSLV